MNDYLWEGEYSSRDAHGKGIFRNVYAKIREEWEEKLAAMIEKVKRAIVEEKKRKKLNNGHPYVILVVTKLVVIIAYLWFGI